MKKLKMVKAWVFSVNCPNGRPLVEISNGNRKDITGLVAYWRRVGAICGPIVRIEVPAPKERKR